MKERKKERKSLRFECWGRNERKPQVERDDEGENVVIRCGKMFSTQTKRNEACIFDNGESVHCVSSSPIRLPLPTFHRQRRS